MTIPIGPVGIFLLANVFANVPNQPRFRLNTPRQLGPTILIPLSNAIFLNSNCALTPEAPISANPDVNITALFTPAAAHSLTTSNAIFSGTDITTLSTGSGTEEILG